MSHRRALVSLVRLVSVVGLLPLMAGGCGSGTDQAKRCQTCLNPDDPQPTAGASGTTGDPKDFGGGPMGGAAGPMGELPMAPVPILDPQATPFVQDDTAMSGLDEGTIKQLKDGGGDCAVNVIYPYEGTVFPGALESPIIMWDSPADAAYVHMTYAKIKPSTVDYEFAVAASMQGELQIPQDAWNEITRRSQNTKLKVKLSVMTGGSVSTCELGWKVAPGNMTGSLYYNTYNAPGAINAENGAVMRLRLGSPMAEVYIQYPDAPNLLPGTGPCWSCHSVSFNGSTIVASFHDYQAKSFRVGSFPISVDVDPVETTPMENANFGALTPDGSMILAMGNPDCSGGGDSFPRSPNNFPLVEGPDDARMLNTTDGSHVAATGLTPENYMWMPQFSPNGDMVVFNHAKPDGAGGTDRRELAVMDYDQATNAFTNLRVIAGNIGPAPSLNYSPAPAMGGAVPGTGAAGCTQAAGPALLPGDVGALNPGTCTEPCYPAFPFFTPDGKAVIFSMVTEPDFMNAFPGREQPSKSELWYVDLDTNEAIALDNINRTLNPANELSDYYPTVMPVAIGGYFWVFWTSRRSYGHRVASSGSAGNVDQDAVGKRIWAAAIRPKVKKDTEVVADPGALQDPSHPGFYVVGQSESGNVRAFATLNPCVASGDTCTAGLDCCTGFCHIEDGAAEGTCTEEVPECSKLNEKCSSDADCCPPETPDQPQAQCLGGFCGFILVE